MECERSKRELFLTAPLVLRFPTVLFFLPMLAWISNEKWKTLSEEDKNKFAPLCPEFVIEVRSKSDNLEDLKKKMSVWIANGTHLAWLIDPIDKVNYIFRCQPFCRRITRFRKKNNSRQTSRRFRAGPFVTSIIEKINRETLTAAAGTRCVGIDKLKSLSVQTIRKI